MAIDINPILTEVNSLCAADGASINKAIFTKYLQDADFAQHHEVMTEVRNNQIIPIITAEPDYGFMKVSQGNCATNSCDYSSTSSSKKWSPTDYDCRVEICKETLDCDFRKFWDMRCKDFDNMEDAFMQFLIEKIMESFNASQWRMSYFDSTSTIAAAPEYSGITGLFSQWETLAPDGADNRIDIPENDGVDIPTQMALAADRGYNVLKAMYDYAAINQPHLLSTSGVHFDITPELAYNYLTYLRDNKEVNCCFNIANNGITSSAFSIESLNYLGIPIRVRNEWRGIIKYFQNVNATANYDKPHRAVLTYKGNKPMGTCDNDAFKSFDMWYEKKDKKLLIDVESSFDTKVLEDTDFVLAM